MGSREQSTAADVRTWLRQHVDLAPCLCVPWWLFEPVHPQGAA